MNELELLILRLEDLSSDAENKEVKRLAKALMRYIKSSKKGEIGFTSKNETRSS